MKGPERAEILTAIEEAAGPDSHRLIRQSDGADVQELRRRLINKFAGRILIRSFGPMTVYRGSWEEPGILVSKKRMRMLLGLLVAASESGLTRDQVLDTIWPDADPAAAVNSLNQTVFQLRRMLEPDYGDGDTAQYVLSSTDSIQLNRDLVRTDLGDLREISRLLVGETELRRRTDLGGRLLALVRGEFLSDLKYEDWVTSAQLAVHADVRSALLPIAEGRMPELGDGAAIKAGRILTILDPFDEGRASGDRSVVRSVGAQKASSRALARLRQAIT